jgi:hypothetical protein
MTKPTKPTVPPAPSRANPGPVFSQTADTFAAFQAPFADYLDALAEFVDERADEALAAALAGDLPPLTGQGGSFARAKPDDTALEFRTPAQVRSDLSINGIGSETRPTITNLNAVTVGDVYEYDLNATGNPVPGRYGTMLHIPTGSVNFARQVAYVSGGDATGQRSFSRWKDGGVWGAWVEFQPALGFTPVEQGGGAGMLTSKLRLGWDDGGGTGLDMIRAQVENTQFGGIVVNASAIGAAVNCDMFAPGAPPLYAARAWVNFNGTNGAIRASGNVSSVVRNGVGDYTINFTTAMPDANYAAAATETLFLSSISTTSCRFVIGSFFPAYDPTQCRVAIFR